MAGCQRGRHQNLFSSPYCHGVSMQSCLEKYWDHGETVKMPFFETYMGRNTFQAILSNLQVLDSTLDLPRNHRMHDPLYKVHPMLDMMDRNFVQSYKCGRDLSLVRAAVLIRGGYFFVVTTLQSLQNGT